MLRFQSFLQKILLVVTFCVIAVTVALYVVSSFMVRKTYAEMTRASLARSADAGARSLRDYAAGTMDRAALQALANPGNNPDGVFLMLLDASGEALAYTREAAPYLAALNPGAAVARLTATGDFFAGDIGAGEDYFLMGRAAADGFVLTGKPVRPYDSALRDFRAALLRYMIPLGAIMALASVLLSVRLAKPAAVIADAARRLSEGELVRVPERLPLELAAVGRAFNHLSARLGETIGALTYERDSMALVLEGLREGVIAVDAQGDLLHENAAAKALLGGRQSAAYARVLSRLRLSVGEAEEPLRLVLGEKTLLAAFSPLPERRDARRGAVATIADITQQERLARTRYDYVANISHELRTPLASVRGVAEGLRDGLVTEAGERQRYYEMIVNEIKRLSRLVNDLLELSSLQSNPAAFETERISVGDTLRELQDRNVKLFADQGLALTLSLAPDLPDACANEDRLQQVLTIFLDNARKYTPAPGKAVLGAERVPGGVRFFVRDTGIGMDAYTARHAFERFHRAEGWHGSQGGSGLGLSIAREILQKMDVRIRLHSEPGAGSEFSFILPRF